MLATNQPTNQPIINDLCTVMDTHKGTQTLLHNSPTCHVFLEMPSLQNPHQQNLWKTKVKIDHHCKSKKCIYNTVYKYTVNYPFFYFKSRYWNSYASTHSYSPSDGAASSISIGINLPLDGCSGVFFFFFLLTLLRITLAKSLMSSFWVDYDIEYSLTFSKFMKEQLSYFSGELAAGTSFQHVTACSVAG